MNTIFSNKNWLIVLLTFVLFSISWKVERNNLLSQNFSKKDQIQLNKFVQSFDKIIIDYFGGKNVEESYLIFFNTLLNIDSDALSFCKEIENIIPKDKKYSTINILDKNLLNKIWLIEKTEDTKMNYKIHGLNLKGNYFIFLEKMNKNNQLLEEYFTAIKNAGDISPFCFNIIRLRQDELPIKDSTYRLILAVHYLTIHD